MCLGESHKKPLKFSGSAIVRTIEIDPMQSLCVSCVLISFHLAFFTFSSF